MKNLFSTLTLLLFCSISLIAQVVPGGMKYQAVARDLDGHILADKKITLQIALFTNGKTKTYHYTERHDAVTNKLGLFTLTIGEGKSLKGGTFDLIPWSTDQVWMELSIDDEGGNDFVLVHSGRLLAVPYAFHAATADNIGENGANKSLSKPWEVEGNHSTVPGQHFIGTIDQKDLVFKTSAQERMRIQAQGKVIITEAQISMAQIGILSALEAQVSGTFDVVDEATFHSDVLIDASLDVNNNVNVGEDLTVDGDTYLNSDLNVDNDLNVGHDGNFGNDITVGQNALIGGALKVGQETELGSTLTVEGMTKMNDELVLSKDQADGGYLATFENTNSGNGDGLKIKLGKKRANDNFLDTSESLSQGDVQKYRDFISDAIPNQDKIDLLVELAQENAIEDLQMLGGLAVGTGNMIIGFINDQLNLPYNVPSVTLPKIPSLGVPGIPIASTINDVFGLPETWDMPWPISNITFPGLPTNVLDVPSFNISTPINNALDLPWSTPSFGIPEIPEIDLSSIGIQEIEVTDPSFWGVPSINLNDVVPNSLNNENDFIHFADMDDQRMGAIRAQSVTDWVTNYLNPVFLYRLRAALKSTVDKKHARYHFIELTSSALGTYAKIGVEYSSGNGDYAEWLERLDPKEAISTGDIVGVKGGKITKDLLDAEQVMAVSHRPIVLGNVPEEGKGHLGNNIAFMGQIPVKVMGPVATGDYIVGKGNILGYGIAISPENMTVEDFKLVVGRAWEANMDNGAKMVNTVIGVHNGDYLNILKRYEQKFLESESRIESVEAKVDLLSELLIQAPENN